MILKIRNYYLTIVNKNLQRWDRFIHETNEYIDELLKAQTAGRHFSCIGRAAVILKAMVKRAKALGMKTYKQVEEWMI
ncbi:MAG: hypothetical protein QMD21_07560 [Candidatus Thermoplasmatota archaeon]|nr:hypothetical protein [Candidatus Thermoplasmatota archaeon]